ncbi:MAG: FHA domain-containing protein, partial [Candidatus Caldarchaeum sp.]
VIALPPDAVTSPRPPSEPKAPVASTQTPSRVGQALLWLVALSVGAGMVYLLYWCARNYPDFLLFLRQKGLSTVLKAPGSASEKHKEPMETAEGDDEPQLSQRAFGGKPSSTLLVPEGTCPYCGTPYRPDGSCACSITPPSDIATVPSLLKRAKLVGEQGAYFIPQGTSIIGRDQSFATLMIPDPTVSRRHAEIRNEEGRLTLKDLGSRNGTFVNGYPVGDEAEIHPGDTVQFGGVRLRVELEE